MIEVEEVFPNDLETLKDFKKFYNLIYSKSFFNADETESYSNLIQYLKKNQTSKEYMYHIILAKNESGVIIGGAIFDYFKKTNCGMIEYLVVDENYRKQGIGSEIYNHVIEIIKKDATKDPCAIFCEVHDSSTHTDHLHFWNKFGFKKVPFNYIQPTLSENQNPTTELSLLMKPNKITPCGAYIVDILMDYMKYSMNIENPQEDDSFLKMYDELMEIDIMELLDVVTQGNP